MAELLQEYELSVWEDVSSGTGLGSFLEKKIAVIGSHNLHTPTKAYNVTLKENVNGEKTLTFSLPRAYRDKDGELKDNPFLSFLTAERKLKLRDGAEYNFFDEDGNFIPSKLEEEDTEDRWTDYVIKTIDEDKESFANNYTCKEVYVNELGKNGWSVVLDSELKNNYGTLPELAERVLEGSGWTVDEDSYVPMEKVAEPLFCAEIVDGQVEATQMVSRDPATLTNYIYTFYSQLQASADGTWHIKDGLTQVQVLWDSGNSFENHQLDDNRQIIDEKDEYNYLVDSALLKNMNWQPTGVATDNVNAIQGGRIVESIYSHYEAVADKYVEEYTIKQSADVGLPEGVASDAPVYHYTETEYLTSDMVKNYIVNASGYTALTGWKPDQNGPTIQTWAYNGKNTAAPTDDSIDNSINYLVLPKSVNNGGIWGGTVIYNEGLKSNDFFLEPEKKYIVRVKARLMREDTGVTYYDQQASMSLRLRYKIDESSSGELMTSDIRFTQAELYGESNESVGYPKAPSQRPKAKESGVWVDNESYYCGLATIQSDVSKAYGKQIRFYLNDVTNRSNSNGGGAAWHIEDIQLFDYVTDENGIPVYPGDIPVAKAVTTDHFYTIGLENGREIAIPLSVNKDNYEPKYNANYSAVRHIDVKESNYFNNINSLAELFGAWVKFKVAHKKNGQLIVENSMPKKTVKFTRFASEGDEINWAGFKYGINLKSIKRNVESTAIASKVIVKNNNNEFAPAGMGSITRAIDNPTGENVIYNFDYYVAHGLLDQSTMINDLYGTTSAHFGYYYKLRELNDKLLPVNEKLTEMQGALDNAKQLLEYSEVQYESASEDYSMQATYYEQDKEIYKGSDDYDIKLAPRRKVLGQLAAARNSAKKDIDIYEAQIADYEQKIYGTSWESNKSYIPGNVVKYITTQSKECWYIARGNVGGGNSPATSTSGKWEQLDFTNALSQDVIDQLPISAQADYWAEQKRQINSDFYRKYYRFIQEATWTDEKYMDDNLYYYDAVKVSAQNAWPKTKYTIGVIDVSGIERLAAYKFKVGQKSYVEDTEFFGYEYINVNGQQIKTPKKKEVVISERSRNFDDPSKSTITIQTYKNQFEELFSKLTATTQSLQYASGEYQKAANTVEADGSIKMESLEQAFANNSFMLANASNQLVTWDSGRGIEVADAKNPLEVTRITSGGIYVSNDGGISWQLGLSAGRGINTRLLTAGVISAEHVNIRSRDGSNAFTWTEDGLTAFAPNGGGSKYVRFNDYGLFGTVRGSDLENAVKNAADFEAALAAIRSYSTFSLTWDGLLLNYQEGATSISPKGGFEVFNKAEGSDWVFKQEYINKYHPCTPEDGIYEAGDSIPIVSLGRYWTSAEENPFGGKIQTYGLRMRNKDGEITLDTDGETGNLWLRNILGVGSNSSQEIMSGIQGRVVEETTSGELDEGEGMNLSTIAFWAGGYNNPKFSVTHEGTLTAQDAFITGQINATSGSFSGSVVAYDALFTGSAWVGSTETIEQTFVEIPAGAGKEEDGITVKVGGTSYLSGINSAPPLPMKWDTTTSTWAEQTNVSNKSETYAFWSGLVKEQIKIAEGEYYYVNTPTFAVNYQGHLQARDVEISGVIIASGDSEFSGRLKAASGDFSGEITANSGQLNYLNLGKNSFISGEDYEFTDDDIEEKDSFYALSINDKRYLLDKLGNSYGASGYFALKEGANPGMLYKDNYMVHIGVDNSPITVYSPSSGDAVFAVDADGNVQIKGTLVGTNLVLRDSFSLNGQIGFGNPESPTMIIKGDQNGGSIYASTPLGTGWSINSDGSANFQNVIVRGKIETSVFEKNHIAGVGGTLLLTPSIILEQDYRPGDKIIVDKIWENIQEVSIVKPNSAPDETLTSIKVESSVRKDEFGNDVVEYRMSILIDVDSEEGANNNDTILPAGTAIISINKQLCSIALSADDEAGPSIIMEHTGQDTQNTVVIGSLSQVTNLTGGLFSPGTVQGYGLYADNAFLTGRLYLPNAGITNESIEKEGSAIRIWAGVSPEDMASAPFIVTEDGSLYASKGIFSGTIIAKSSSFSGTISASGVVLSNNYETDNEEEYQYFTIGWHDKPWDDDKSLKFDIAQFHSDGLNIYKNLSVGIQYTDEDDVSTVHDPILQTIDSSRTGRVLASNLQITNYYHPEILSDIRYISTINIKPTIMSFIKRKTEDSIRDLDSLWEDESSFTLGIFDDGCAGLSGSKISFTSQQKHENAALVIEPGFKNDSGVTVKAKTTLNGMLQFESTIEVKTVSDGLVFNYIGDE